MLTAEILTLAEELRAGCPALANKTDICRPSFPFYRLAIVKELSGFHAEVADPFLASIEGHGQSIQPHQ